ncbi:CHASE3 domain-containing protein, partial [Mycobacterium tuberculosis]
ADFNGWVAHTYMAQQRIVAFQAAVERAETARRGYLLAPTPEQLATYQSARSEVSATLYQMAVTTSDNPAQRANIARIRPLITWKTKVNDDSVA